MQVPEKLSLIGGSILLSSILVFTLKGQASNIVSKVGSNVDNVMAGKNVTKERQQQEQDAENQRQAEEHKRQEEFNNSFAGKVQQAQQKGWQTGYWGSSEFYIDSQGIMHVGAGTLRGSYVDSANISNVKNISFDEAVKAPVDSSNLFANPGNINEKLTSINHLDQLDTSQVTSMESIFANDRAINNLDLANFDTSKVTNMSFMFQNDSLNDLDFNHFDTSHVDNMNDMFANTTFNPDDLDGNLNLTNFDTRNVKRMQDMFTNAQFGTITLGNNSWFTQDSGLNEGFMEKDTMQNLHLNVDMPLPGTWVQ